MSARSGRWFAFFSSLLALAGVLYWVLISPGPSLPASMDAKQQGHGGDAMEAQVAGGAVSEAQALATPEDSTTDERQRAALGVTTPEAGFLFRGRLSFPDDVSWDPKDARVYAVHGQSGYLIHGQLADVIALGEPAAKRVDADGRFSIRLPGDEPLEESWTICAGVPGWVRMRRFPDVRPNSPDPSEEVELQMQPLYGATIELVMPDGGRPKLDRSMLASSGGSGVHYLQGWGWGYPMEPTHAAMLLGIPEDLRSQAVGGLDAARGLSGPELAVFQAHQNLPKGPDCVVLSYKIAPPGFAEVSRGLDFRTLAEGFPAYQIELNTPSETGSVQFHLDEAEWWREELDPHDLGGFNVELLRGEENPWVRRFTLSPTAKKLHFDGLPEGEYSVSVRTRINGLSVPVQPNVILVRAGLEADARIQLGGFGAIALDVLEEDRAGWAAGRFSIQVPRSSGGDPLRFFTESWPVRLGPIQDETVSVLLRAIDGDDQYRMADRLNSDDEFAVPRMGTMNYVLGGRN